MKKHNYPSFTIGVAASKMLYYYITVLRNLRLKLEKSLLFFYKKLVFYEAGYDMLKKFVLKKKKKRL